jgi:hypothetical protein
VEAGTWQPGPHSGGNIPTRGYKKAPHFPLNPTVKKWRWVAVAGGNRVFSDGVRILRVKISIESLSNTQS